MMNSGLIRGPGSGGGGGSSSSRKSEDVVPNQFPAGLRVLVVDDDSTCLMILERMLRTCLYEVTKCNRAEIALSLLRKDRNGFDIVLSDVHMPDMDGFKLLEHVGLEMDLPVIMMSADDSRHVVMKGVTHGARDYLIKPVRIEALKNIWQHVVRKRRSEWSIPEQCGSFEDGSQHKPNEETDNNSSSLNEGTNNSWRNVKRKKEEEGEDQEDKDDSSTLKKPRVVWSVELHQQFVAAVNQLGVDKAVPKRILELMNVPGLTRENVASHLQKYRIYLRRIGGVAQHQGNLSNAFISPQEASFSQLSSSLGGFDLQALAAAGLPAQSLAQLQVAAIGRPTAPKSGIPVLSLADQRHVFSFENPKVRFAEGQSMIGVGNQNKQMNLLHGIPTAMEPKRLAGLQSVGVYGFENQIMVHGGQQMQPLGQILPSSFGQPHMPNNLSGRSHIPDSVTGRKSMPCNVFGTKVVPDSVSGRRNGVNDRVNQAYNAMSQHDSSVFSNFPLNQTGELLGNGFPRANAPGIPTSVSKGEAYQEEVNSSDTKRSSGLTPCYDMFNDLQHHSKSVDWDLQNAGVGDNLDAASVFPVSEGYSSSSSSLNRYGQKTEINQHMDSFFAGNGSTRVKSERALETGCLPQQFPDQYNQEDLMSALLRQEGIAPAENDFEFDGYSIDNVPVL